VDVQSATHRRLTARCSSNGDHQADDGIGGDGGGAFDRTADDEHVRVAGAAVGDDFHIGAERAAGFAGEPRRQRAAQVEDDLVMRDRPAGHGDRGGAVELVAQLLPFLPGEELIQIHGLKDRTHNGKPSMAASRAPKPNYAASDAR